MARTRLPDPPPALNFTASQDIADNPQAIQGLQPASLWEWWFAVALDELGIGYDYQVDLNGGRSVRGGQVVDFLVWTATGPVAVFVNGPYWHALKDPNEDILHQEEARQRWGKVYVMDEDPGRGRAGLNRIRQIVKKELL